MKSFFEFYLLITFIFSFNCMVSAQPTPPSQRCVNECAVQNCYVECLGYEGIAACNAAYCKSATRGFMSNAICIGGQCHAMCFDKNCTSKCQGDACKSECDGYICTSYCNGGVCSSKCEGEACNAFCESGSCVAASNGEKSISLCYGNTCHVHCTGIRCRAKCYGEDCISGCTGSNCRSECSGERCQTRPYRGDDHYENDTRQLCVNQQPDRNLEYKQLNENDQPDDIQLLDAVRQSFDNLQLDVFRPNTKRLLDSNEKLDDNLQPDKSIDAVSNRKRDADSQLDDDHGVTVLSDQILVDHKHPSDVDIYDSPQPSQESEEPMFTVKFEMNY